jgi:hypothetical protein
MANEIAFLNHEAAGCTGSNQYMMWDVGWLVEKVGM